MINFSFQFDRGPDHRRVVTWLSLVLITLCYLCNTARAQTAVILSPLPIQQLFTQNGQPLAFGCVFSYQVATSTPLSTFTDYTGTTLNANPVILSASGTYSMWLQAGVAYTLVVKSSGGSNCASGSTIGMVNGVGGGSTTLTTIVPFSSTPAFQVAAQTQLFTLTLTGNASAQPLTFVGVTPPSVIFFQITQDGAGGHTFSWPANSIGGCTIGSNANQVTTQEFVYNGSNATAVGPCVTGNGPSVDVGSLVATGTVTASQLISTVAGPTPPLVVTSNAEVLNLNVNFLEGFDWASPGTIGSTAPNTGVFTTLRANTSFTLNGSTAQTSITGTDTSLATAGTVTAGATLACFDANSGVTSSNCNTGFAPQRVVLSSPVSLTATTQTTILTEVVTFPSTPGTYRADSRYGMYVTAGSNVCVAEVVDATNTHAFAISGQDANGAGFIALSGSEISANTYAAGATATFNLSVQCNNGGGGLVGVTVNSGFLTMSPAEPTYLSVTPIHSN